jgi:3',5'-cyclic AMP phosphodiesterase CpdA
MKDKIKRLIQILILSILFGPASGLSADSLMLPERIILNPTTDPSHGQAVTWRSLDNLAEPSVQIAPARSGVDLEDYSKTVMAKKEKVAIQDKEPAWHYSAVIRGLKPGTAYNYRAGSGESWSEWTAFTTAEEYFKPFTFVYMGDPQLGLRTYCPRLFRQALRSAPDARFWLFAGDQVNVGNSDEDFRDLFYAGSWMFRSINIIPVAGNHEYPKSANLITRELTPLWRPHYTLPENGPDGLEETSYWLDYQGVKLIVLNGNEKKSEQRDWLEKILKENNSRWTVAAIHQPIYSTGSERDNPELQELFLPLFDEYGVDLVLQGHDHTYGRTFPLKAGKIATAGDKGTVYVVSSSGAKFYKQNPLYLGLMAKTALNTQLFQVINVQENSLHFKAVTVNGDVIDEFTVIRE